jgi:hypothetical protein
MSEFTISIVTHPFEGAKKPFYSAYCKELELDAFGDTPEEAREELGKIVLDHFDWIDKHDHSSSLTDYFKDQLKYRDYVMP